ncbi:hypothetical protein B0T20DRAFT_247921 [Sordaria brevicollis]|uniref:Uncharacterized protein n=1 Tax=Sordaria brevicollis TaxID=83679 RepID=A0AAE0UAM8_SORBR|nr:hypothetical protein B0T20DRAFT_247921 [Sordaria brevicollis]
MIMNLTRASQSTTTQHFWWADEQDALTRQQQANVWLIFWAVTHLFAHCFKETRKRKLTEGVPPVSGKDKDSFYCQSAEPHMYTSSVWQKLCAIHHAAYHALPMRHFPELRKSSACQSDPFVCSFSVHRCVTVRPWSLLRDHSNVSMGLIGGLILTTALSFKEWNDLGCPVISVPPRRIIFSTKYLICRKDVKRVEITWRARGVGA